LGKKISRVVLTFFGALLGCGLVILVDEILMAFGVPSIHVALLTAALIAIYLVCGITCAIIFYIISPKLIDRFLDFVKQTEIKLTQMPIMDIFFGVLGLILGLLVALLFSTLVNEIPIPWLAILINIGLYILCGYLGCSIAVKRRAEVNPSDWMKQNKQETTQQTGSSKYARPKILDTSVIIDGRIADICKTGVVEGELVVPGFVLKELQHIADSSDALKRNRGRRGLDILNTMQKDLRQPITVEEKDYDDIAEVDSKLIRLAYDVNGVVVTNDYNLNKVAGVKKVPVLNINELANALRPVVLPGEEMHVTVMNEGKEAGQGVGYLDDGTMIVVEAGRKHVGQDVEVIVTSVLQTSAGRMIFAKLKQDRH